MTFLSSMPKPSFTLGADPEFVVFNSAATLVTAAETRFRSEEEELGADHCGRPFELRPDPCECPLELVSSMRSILVTHVMRHPGFYDYTWRAGSYHRTPQGIDTPIGGHIHVGGLGAPQGRAVELLDSYVGTITCLLEDRKEGYARRHCNNAYGFASDVRAQEYGFEYRTPASWLGSPHVAAGILCLAKAVLHQLVTHPRFRFHTIADTDYINEMETECLRQQEYPDLRKCLRSMDLYPEYRTHLDFLDFLILNCRSWHPKRGMKEAWGIADPDLCAGTPATMSSVWGRLGEVTESRVVAKKGVDKAPEKSPSGRMSGTITREEYEDALARVTGRPRFRVVPDPNSNGDVDLSGILANT